MDVRPDPLHFLNVLTHYLREMLGLFADTDKEKINNFIEHANNYHPSIKFTTDISDKEIIFLDTVMHLQRSKI